MPNGVQETFVCFVTCVYWVLKPSYSGSVKWHHRRRRSRRYASNYWKSTVVMLLRPGTVWVAKLLLEGHLTVYFIFLRFAFPKGFGSRPYWASDHLSNGSPGIAEVLQYQQIYTFAAIIVQERPSMVCISERPCWASDHLPDGSPGIAARSQLEGLSTLFQNCYSGRAPLPSLPSMPSLQCNAIPTQGCNKCASRLGMCAPLLYWSPHFPADPTSPIHNGVSNEIKEIEVCKKCPKCRILLRAHFWSKYVRIFFGWCQITPNFVPTVFLCKNSQILGVFFFGFLWKTLTAGQINLKLGM